MPPGKSTPPAEVHYDLMGSPYPPPYPQHSDYQGVPQGIPETSATAVVPVAVPVNVPTSSPEPVPEEEKMSIDDLMHAIGSFGVILWPVAITMILAVICVTNIASPQDQAAMGAYLVVSSSTDGGSESAWGAAANALVIIGVIAVLTFVIVLLYKYNCMKFLVGYLLFASSLLLGYFGGTLVITTISDNWNWPVDWFSFAFIMYNFAIVGTTSIFYQKGLPFWVNQCYLVITSVILAWKLSQWPEWTTWALLVALALYDLCAVLTPCGPLNALIKLIQKDGRPMPGLLYEAQVPQHDQHKADNENDRQEDNQARDGDSSHEQPADPHSVQAVQGAIDLDMAVSTSDQEQRRWALYNEILAFYDTYAPEHRHKAGALADRFVDGDQERMWQLLEYKYIIRPQEEREDRTIKLGLGDFVFYSVLVGKAAQYDFTTMVATFICILMGLAGTLFLLSVMHKALPALPISIFLATIFYFLTRLIIIDYLNVLLMSPSYV